MSLRIKFLCVSLLLLTLLQTSVTLHALQVTGYTSLANDRFSSGFPTAPIPNTDASFVGSDLDWSGIAWSTTTYDSSSYKSLAMLSPRHFLTAQHYEYTPSDGNGNLNQRTTGVRVRGIDGNASTVSGVTSVDNMGYGLKLTAFNQANNYDLAVATLSSNVTAPTNMAKMAVLDLYSSSSATSFTAYNSLQLLLHGRGSSTNASPRTASDTPNLIAAFSSDANQIAIRTTHPAVQMQGGDSGSPIMHAWTNPNGGQELTVLGINSAVDDTNGYNYSSFFAAPGAIQTAQAAMNPSGYSLRVDGNPSNTWVGNSSNQIARNSAWGIGGNPNNTGATIDKYVLFDPTSAANQSINVNSNYELRGLYFKASATSSDPFTFSGSSTLTVGRGGITNYDADQQTFTASLRLGAPQYWDTGSGGLSAANLNTNGHLLELKSTGSSTISGNISGAGSLAMSGGTLTLSGTSSYTGSTWAHEGDLIVSGSIANSSSLTLDSSAVLSGSGSVPSIEGNGIVSPGNSPGILTTTSIDPIGGLDFNFEFTAASAPDFGTATASINDLLRITAATPFKNNLNSSNEISIYLNVASLFSGQEFLGGFFADGNTDFYSAIENAQITTYIADPAGSVSFNGQTYSSNITPYLFTLSTAAQSADFGTGVVSGRILQIQVELDQTQYAGWKLYHSLAGNDALNTADTDDDGIGQLHEFALGGDPNENDLSILPTHSLVEDGGSSYLELNVTRPIGLQGISYTPRTTTDLSNWPVGSIDIANPNPTPVNNLDGSETLTYRRSQAVAAADKAFIRVEISETP